MKDRIIEIMRKENMTQQNFAAALEISPATLSNIFNGKTNPTSNQVFAIHKRFPNINISWLMFGEGEMYNQDSLSVADNPDIASSSNIRNILPDTTQNNTSGEQLMTGTQNIAIHRGLLNPGDYASHMNFIDKPQKKIIEIRIFFDDGTFETFTK